MVGVVGLRRRWWRRCVVVAPVVGGVVAGEPAGAAVDDSGRGYVRQPVRVSDAAAVRESIADDFFMMV